MYVLINLEHPHKGGWLRVDQIQCFVQDKKRDGRWADIGYFAQSLGCLTF